MIIKTSSERIDRFSGFLLTACFEDPDKKSTYQLTKMHESSYMKVYVDGVGSLIFGGVFGSDFSIECRKIIARRLWNSLREEGFVLVTADE